MDISLTNYDVVQALPEDIWSDDATGKLQQISETLTAGLTAHQESFVLNIDSAWGSGKTFFVRRWLADLHDKGYCTVYFNAWENDCAEDPLLPFASVMAKELGDVVPEYKKCFFRLKKAAAVMSLDGSKIALMTFANLAGGPGTTQITGRLMGSLTSKMVALSDAKIEKREEFRKLLRELITAVQKQKEKDSPGTLKPIIVFIDEMDRCRPSFAVELLERVKHLFGEEGLKFVIVSDTAQLAESVKALYGNGFDADVYLQRFFNARFTLPYLEPSKLIETAFSGVPLGYKHELCDILDAFRISLRQTMSFIAQSRMVLQIKKAYMGYTYVRLIYFLMALKIKSVDDFANVCKFQSDVDWQKLNEKLDINPNSLILACESRINKATKSLNQPVIAGAHTQEYQYLEEIDFNKLNDICDLISLVDQREYVPSDQ